MGVPSKTVGVMFTPLTVKYLYYDTERIGGQTFFHFIRSKLNDTTDILDWNVVTVVYFKNSIFSFEHIRIMD